MGSPGAIWRARSSPFPNFAPSCGDFFKRCDLVEDEIRVLVVQQQKVVTGSGHVIGATVAVVEALEGQAEIN